ncbi:MAG: serine/threonine protein kinase [Chitinispirillaceae bacterium]|nr:serine/threonine protein kinase [Chitinispirillaceae bacterium]
MKTPPDSTVTPKNTGGKAPMREMLPQEGDLLGHCRIMELIAAGGMANVYKVWHEQLEVVRALKILKPGFSEESRGRLETEAKISANLRHANIVEIYGMGYWNDIPYIEMEYVEGPSLKELLEKNTRLPVQFSLSVVHSVCTALKFAYNQDMTLYGRIYDRLIHRDIKPANILLSSRGVVKLADFGIARPSEASIHTVGSKVMGTFAYLSPEQLNGEKLDQRSDVYSLGTVLYEMLTGSKTFPQKLLAELVQRKSRGQFIPVGAMGVNLSRQLCSAVEKSLALDRNKRFCDAGEFDLELTAALRKISSKTPDDIIRVYLKNPWSPGVQRKRTVPFRPILISTGVILAITIVVIAVLRLPPLVTGQVNEWKRRLLSVAVAPPPAVPPQPAAAPAPQKVAAAPSTPSVTVPRTPHKPVPVDPLTAGLKAFSSGDFTTAIAKLESVDPDQLQSPLQRTQRTIRLLQSYIGAGRIDDAYSFSTATEINDGLFYLLRSKAAQRKNHLERALADARTASTTPSQLDRSVRQKAQFQIASLLHERYLAKPNRTNTQLTRDEWETYLAAYCTESVATKECSEAREKLSSLEQ